MALAMPGMAVHRGLCRRMDQQLRRAVKGPKRHQAVSGYWHTQQTLGRWCRIRSYLDSAANHGFTALDAISNALAGNPWLPATQPAIPIARELKPRPEPAVAWLPATLPAIPAAA